MRAEKSSRSRYAGLAAVATLLLSVGGAGSQVVTPPSTGFEYAVKFICGATPATNPGVVARGVYFTAINVHNPGKEGTEFTKKFAIALPGEKAGRVSPFFLTPLGPDQALEIDCPDIGRHLDVSGFVKGFAVIQSKVELDVVAVYTAAGSATGTVVALDTERVPARKY